MEHFEWYLYLHLESKKKGMHSGKVQPLQMILPPDKEYQTKTPRPFRLTAYDKSTKCIRTTKGKE